MNRHNPPTDLTPQQRRWLEQAKARRGIIYTPWRVEREPTQSTQAPAVKYIPCKGPGCKALIRSKSGAKYCGSCNYDLRQQRMAKRAKQARERYAQQKAQGASKQLSTVRKAQRDRERYERKKQEREAA